MPRYSYHCSLCHREVILTREVKDRNRSEPCHFLLEVQPLSTGLRSRGYKCSGLLQREGIDLTARMLWATKF